MSELPRIAHIISPLSWRGGEQQAIYLYEELDKLGVYQVILCAKGSVTEQYCQNHGLKFRSFKKRLNIDPFFARFIRRVCREEKIDIIHPHDSVAHTLSILAADLFSNPCPLVLHRRVDFPISSTWFSRYKYNHPSIKRIICVSEAVREILQKDIRNKSLLRVVYDGIDVESFETPKGSVLRNEFDVPADVPVVANIAALTQQKDYFTFIDSVAILEKEGFHAAYFAFGDGYQREKILAYAEEKGLKNRIRFAGFRNDIRTILPEIDVLLFSSETEGLGTTILDCFAAGVPVVSTNAGGIPEIMVHLKTGWMGQVKDPRSLAEGVKIALTQPEIAANWVEEGKKRVQGFRRSITAKNTLDIYQEIKASEKN
jgi:glycosyltransferase involved in cell wall biosynthesis